MGASVQAAGPFNEGTERIVLTDDERAQLTEFSDNSRARLELAIQEAQGLELTQAGEVYLEAVKAIMLKSYQQKYRNELLMRFTLGQALELTYGVPTPDGRHTEIPGILRGISNPDLLPLILEDSMKMAIEYFQDDRTAIKNGSLQQLPYMKQAVDRLTLARKWMASVTEPSALYSFSVTALQHFMNTAAKDEQLQLVFYAEELVQLERLLYEFKLTPPKSSSALIRAVRTLRGEIKRLHESAAKKLSAQLRIPTLSLGFSPLGAFRVIPAGVFAMGSPAGESYREPDETQHNVRLTRDFEMQVTTMTQAQWVYWMGQNPSRFKQKRHCPESYSEDPVPMCPDHPVERVSYRDIQTLIQKVNTRMEDGYLYRLPTEAEWEYAARATSSSPYEFGNDVSQLPLRAWYALNSERRTHAVALLLPNGFGLFDMHGNVQQWTSDRFAPLESKDATDPVGPETNWRTPREDRVVKGGSYFATAEFQRCAFRGRASESTAEIWIGFRLVRVMKR